RPEEVLQRVETAAEQNLPIEQLYERRHEIKDDSTKQPASSTVSKAGKEPRYAAPPIPPPYNPMPTLKQQLASARNAIMEQEMYRQAVASGFWGGIAIVILMGVAVLVQ